MGIEMKSSVEKRALSRRTFLKTTAAAGAASLVAGTGGVFAAGSDRIRVGLIGCGGRGTGAGIIDCAQSSPGVELVAMGDLFQDHIEQAPQVIMQNLQEKELA